MSKHKLRIEKDCLNCGSLVEERFCTHCGQENIPVRQSAGSMITHFMADLLHFDGNFFHTIKLLFSRPGLVPKEYVRGKRKRFLDPIRMYLFTSAIFFIVFFSANKGSGAIDLDEGNLNLEERVDLAYRLSKEVSSGKTEWKPVVDYLIDTSYSIDMEDSKPRSDSIYFPLIYKGKNKYLVADKWTHNRPDSSFGGLFDGPTQRFNEEYKRDPKGATSRLWDKALHQFPYLLFLSLPFFALILKLLYFRRKQFFYSDHAVFTLYQYILTFFLMLVFFGLNKIDEIPGYTWVKPITVVVFLSGGIFLFIAMKRFYQQGFGKTLLKFIMLNILATVVMILLLTLLFLLAFVQY